MKKPLLTAFCFFIICNLFSQKQKVIGDCSITYTVSSADNTKKNNLEDAVKKIFIRGKQIRIDLSSNTFNQTIFYNDNTGEATVLKSIGESKYISTYTTADWQKQNTVYNDIKILFTNNTKKILNYTCKEAVIQLTNGISYLVYYIPDLLPLVTENTFEFKNVPGLILQYQTNVGDEKIQYIASSISFDPVPVFRFNVPTSGYKILND